MLVTGSTALYVSWDPHLCAVHSARPTGMIQQKQHLKASGTAQMKTPKNVDSIIHATSGGQLLARRLELLKLIESVTTEDNIECYVEWLKTWEPKDLLPGPKLLSWDEAMIELNGKTFTAISSLDIKLDDCIREPVNHYTCRSFRPELEQQREPRVLESTAEFTVHGRAPAGEGPWFVKHGFDLTDWSSDDHCW